jgi:hypothetical protein
MTSPDQKVVAVISGIGGNVTTYDTQNWAILQRSKVEKGAFSLCVFGQGQFVGVGSNLGQVIILKTMSGQVVAKFQAYEQSPFGSLSLGAIAGDPSGNLVFVGVDQANLDGQYSGKKEAIAWQQSIEPAKVLRARDGGLVASISSASRPIRHAAWDPKGRYVAFVDNARGLFFWRPDQREGALTRVELATKTLSLSVSPDGEHVAVTADRGVTVFKLN